MDIYEKRGGKILTLLELRSININMNIKQEPLPSVHSYKKHSESYQAIEQLASFSNLWFHEFVYFSITTAKQVPLNSLYYLNKHFLTDGMTL